MALCEAVSLLRLATHSRLRAFSPSAATHLSTRRNNSTAAAQPTDELESTPTFSAPVASGDTIKKFDPAGWAKSRTRRLPTSRYQFRSPKYYRGPLHPHQPPRESDPASRAFQPGPFTSPRLEQTYRSTIEPDYMTLTYTHFPPGYQTPERAQRLREWVGDSPYFKNRPLRGPRGGVVLYPLRKPITFRNVPRITGVTVNSFVEEANENSAYLHVASMIIQSITGVRCESRKARTNVIQWGHKKGKYVAVVAPMKGEDAHNFLSKMLDVVMPRIKEYKGVAGSSGDSTGNISLGFTPDQVASFPEVEFNYDMYPPKMIPGCNVTIHTTASNDRDARLLMEAIGIPFYGKHVN